MKRSGEIEVYLEVGKKKTFAGAIEWPGWCRSGKDEETALQALFDYAPRYAPIARAARLQFQTPANVSTFHVVERIEGNATTDFGAPAVAPSTDAKAVNEAELTRLQNLFRGCWRTFDKIVKSAEGKELLKGPRGGGRQLQAIVAHVIGADAAYLSRIGSKFTTGDSRDALNDLAASRKAILSALAAAARGQVAERGPRGGTRWSPRYFVRRSAWHILDHAWEIEDRARATERRAG